MTTMSSPVQVLLPCLLVLAGLVVQEPGAEKKPVGPAPDRISFERVMPDATVDLIGATDISATADAVWVVSRETGVVSRLDPASNAVAATVTPGEWPCAGLAEAFGSLWVPLCGEYGMARISLESNELQTTMATGIADADGSIASGVGSIWILTGTNGILQRLDPDTNRPVAEVYLPAGSYAAVFGHEALWVTSADKGTVSRVDPHTNLVVKTMTVGTGARHMAIGDDAVWVLNAGDGTVSRIDPKANRVSATIQVSEPAGLDKSALAKGRIAAGAGSVWISAPGLPLARFDPRSNTLVQMLEGEGGGPLAVGHKSLWLLISPEKLLRIDPRLVAALR
jgi:YVTN family beta-propeller protein